RSSGNLSSTCASLAWSKRRRRLRAVRWRAGSAQLRRRTTMTIIDGNARLRAASGVAAAHEFLSLMDRLGIDKAGVAGGGYISPEQLAEHAVRGGGLDVDVDHGLLLEQCAVAPERLIPVYIANPHRGITDYRERGRAFCALKLAPVLHGVPLRDPRT